ncbi:hypothetical protein CQ020_06135 [Arthrobacter sp. MYb23]|uniref:hypothetical protein n=1 Tax=unclassified Arthrobacter TaxID=235627 RepID=UPI000CFCBB3C|nr:MULTISPECIES: hypothetical protein [unclassified Arthrobacter]PRB43069.1 hypothetical protein CQ038_08765 [Arthrobacter sp. MYb51]PRB98021.1 hypothetical protein CQ020_06135 [Arthrobacter sp. MYb23]
MDTADFGGITRLTQTGIVVGETHYEVDCVIIATGFDAGVSGVLSGTLPVYGCNQRSLLEARAQDPCTLRAFTTMGSRTSSSSVH